MLKKAIVCPVSHGVSVSAVPERCRNRRLEIMETTRWVILRYVLGVDGTIHLLYHLEVLMDGVAGEGVERHVRTCQLERSRRQGVDVGNANIRAEREAQTRTPGAEEALICRWQARIAAQGGSGCRHRVTPHQRR